MKARALLVGVLALLLVGLGVVWWRTYERRDEWIDLPRTGEAASNPLYALKLALRNDGVRVQSRRRLQLDSVPLAPRDTLLLYGDPREVDTADADTLLQWVRGGGHLIVRTPPPARPQRTRTRKAISEDGFGPVPLFDRLHVDASTFPPQCVPLAMPGEETHVEFCNGRRVLPRADTYALTSWGDASGSFGLIRVGVERGSADVLADLDFLTTDKLMDGPHIALTRQLLAPNYRAGSVHLVYDAQLPSLWWSLLRHGWMAWVPLLLALLAWLFARTQRFGPLLPAPADERRSLLEHIVASGQHTHRYGYGHLLHAAARAAFLARLRRRDPQAAALDGDVQAALIAARFHLPAADIRAALATPVPRDHAAFRTRIATLIRLRNQL